MEQLEVDPGAHDDDPLRIGLAPADHHRGLVARDRDDEVRLRRAGDLPGQPGRRLRRLAVAQGRIGVRGDGVERHEVRDPRGARQGQRRDPGHPVMRVDHVEPVQRSEVRAELVDVLVDLALRQRRRRAGRDLVDERAVVEDLRTRGGGGRASGEELDGDAPFPERPRQRADEDVHATGVGGSCPLGGGGVQTDEGDAHATTLQPRSAPQTSFGSPLNVVLVFSLGSQGPLRAWRNGRRAGFRCQCPQGRGGSTPLARTDEPQLTRRYTESAGVSSLCGPRRRHVGGMGGDSRRSIRSAPRPA